MQHAIVPLPTLGLLGSTLTITAFGSKPSAGVGSIAPAGGVSGAGGDISR
jgi:hypothetical protein